jgi:O-antigen/teichoic acid export membrane protein
MSATPAASSPSPEEASPRVSIGRGTAWGTAADAATVVSALLVSILIARFLGPTNRGIYFLAVLAGTLIALFADAGLSTSGLVFASKRSLDCRLLHGATIILSAGTALASAVLLQAFAPALTDSILNGLDRTQLWLVAAAIGPLIYGQVASSILTGLGRLPTLAVIRIGIAVATPIFTTAALWATDGDTTWALIAWVAMAVLLAAPIAVDLVRQTGRPRAPGLGAWKRMMGFGLRAHVGTMSHHGFLRIDVLFLGARRGPADVGQYSLASLLAERIALIGSALYAAGASHIGAHDVNGAEQLTARMLRVLTLVIMPVAIVLALIAHPLITILFGDDYAPAVLPFVLLLPGTVCLTLWHVLSLHLIAALERPGLTTIIQGTALLISLPAYYVAVSASGMTGAALVSSGIYVGVFLTGLGIFLRGARVEARSLVPGRADVRLLRDLAADALQVVKRGGAGA